MGIGSSKKKILTTEEIDRIAANNTTLEKLFMYYKGYEGYIYKKDFEYLFQRKIDFQISSKLYKLFASEKEKFVYEDLKYFYSVFLSKSYITKINFLCELIFNYKPSKLLSKYKDKVNLMFERHSELKSKLLSAEFIKRICEKGATNPKVLRENFTKHFTSLYENFVVNFEFIRANTKSTKIKYKYGAKNTCICDCYFSSKLKSESSGDLNEYIYDKMESEFRRMEKLNDGVFSINILENMLREIDINEKIIGLISLYLKRKSEKNFIDFKTFKNFLLCFLGGNEDRIKMLFEIISFPKDYIDKLFLIKFLSNFDIKEDIKEFLEEKINLGSFISLFTQYSIFTHIINYIEHINYLPYIFFKLRPDEKRIERTCIELLTKGEKNIAKYVEKILSSEKELFCVNIEFWENWCTYVEWDGVGPNLDTTNPKTLENKNISQRPVISNNSILGRHPGQLNSTKIYLKDFIVFPYKIYDLFTRWYSSSGVEIKFKIINYKKTSRNEFSTSKDDVMSPPMDFSQKLLNDRIYKIDFRPIFIKYFSFEEIVKNITTCSFQAFKDLLKNLYESSLNLTRLCNFPRTTTLNEIKIAVENFYKLSKIKTNIWVYSKYEFKKIENLELTLEEANIDEFCLVILELMKDNKWQSEILDSGQINSSNTNFHKSLDNSLIGIYNIGNTCYMNSVLQILLNLKEIREIFLTKNFSYCINYNNKFGFKGKIIKEFLKILVEKWGMGEKDFKSLRPTLFKEQIGEINEQFKNCEQQDAQEFFNFLLDVLHEEINLKSVKEYIPNPESFDYTPSELSTEYWANNLRRNASFIHSLFLGQLESKLICSRCETCKTTYETFTNLVLPISQKKSIFLEVVFFRVPFIFKSYYVDKLDRKDLNEIDIRKSLNQIRKQSLENYASMTSEDRNFENHLINNPGKEKENTDECVQDPQESTNLNLYSSRLSTSIPIKIIFEVEGKHRVKKLISLLKGMKELELEEENVKEDQINCNREKFLKENHPHSTFIVMSGIEGSFIDLEMKIDECFQNNQTVYVYELLNTKGIEKIMSNKETEFLPSIGLTQSKKSSSMLALPEENLINPSKLQIKNLNQEDAKYNTHKISETPGLIYSSTSQDFSNIYINNNNYCSATTTTSTQNIKHSHTENELVALNYEILSKYKQPAILEKKIESENLKVEYLVPIINRYPCQTREFYLFRNVTFQKLDFLFNIILVNNKRNFNARFLYDYIWEKFEYILTDSKRIKSSLWWQKYEDDNFFKSNNEDEYYLSKFKNLSLNEIKYCSPYVLKILDREKEACVKCPWFNFCTGCILDPFNEENLVILPSHTIVVEWCYDIVKTEMNEANLRLILNHPSVKNREEDTSVKTLDECINLFLEKEYLEGEDQKIYCSKCKSLSNFYKKFNFDRMPPILILSIKRFKFAKLYKKKIDNLIHFPLYDLNLEKNSYDLFGIVNHSGVLSAGHYTATVKVNGKWIKCDDSSLYEVDENSIVTPGAYILIYKLKGEIRTDYFSLMNYILNNLDIQISNKLIGDENRKIDTFYLPDEPVTTIYGRAYVIKEICRDNVKIIQCKFRFGQGFLNEKSVKKEIYLDKSFLHPPNKFEKERTKEIKKEPSKEEKKGGDCIIF